MKCKQYARGIGQGRAAFNGPGDCKQQNCLGIKNGKTITNIGVAALVLLGTITNSSCYLGLGAPCQLCEPFLSNLLK